MLLRQSLIAAVVLCALTPALAEDSREAPARPFELRATAAYPLRQDAGQWMGSNLIGAEVVSAYSDPVGRIENLVVNENGAVEAVVIKVGGFLGFGGRNVAVTYDSLIIVRNLKGDGIDHVTISATKKDLIQAVPFQTLRQQHAQR
jgi:sporulation protein YlmC with PRC-barrel domain